MPIARNPGQTTFGATKDGPVDRQLLLDADLGVLTLKSALQKTEQES